MAQPRANVNDASVFINAFTGNLFLRLLHGDYDPKTHEPKRLRPRQFYGTPAECIDYLERVATRLNDGSDDEHKFNVFYCANDPGQGNHAQQDDIGHLRVIYQDCDEPEVAAIEPDLDGAQSHFVIESSPGKRQRIWHIEPIEAFRHRAVHDHMVARRYHDPSTHGPHRLLRMPGFHNWKYPDGPVASVVTHREYPRLTRQQVFNAFGFKEHGEPGNNLNAFAANIQRSGDLPGEVVSFQRERAKRQGYRDTDKEAEAGQRDAHDAKPGQMPVGTLLDALALIEPDTHRNEWRKVLAALHYMSGDREWGQVIAESWSMMGMDKWSEKAFKQHWDGLDRNVANPASWLSIRRMTANRRHTKESRALRQCPAFKRFEEEHGPLLDYEQLFVEYPIQMKIETADGPTWRPDARARRNVEHLMTLEGIEVYFDEFQQEALVKVDGIPREIDQRIIMELYSTAHVTGLRIDDAFLTKQLEGIALDNKRDPVREFLSRLPMWDGKERLATVFQRLMGAPDTPSIREILPLIMCAMIRRTREPGYKFDLMPILEGKQGLGKSSFFRVLMPNEEWFGEGPKLNEEAKRLLSQIGGKLVIEFGELVGMSPQNMDAVKKLITQRFDEYIPNYARKKVRAPRRCVFIGSVDKTTYLRDLGDNRRFPIIPVTKELDYAELKAEREQLWAEALLEEAFMGELRLSNDGEADMKELQETRLDMNTETRAFMDDMAKFDVGFIMLEFIWERLGIPFHERWKRTGHAQFLLKEVRHLMERNGWIWNGVIDHKGKSIRAVYRKKRRGPLPEIVCNGGVLCYASDIHEPTIEELLS